MSDCPSWRKILFDCLKSHQNSTPLASLATIRARIPVDGWIGHKLWPAVRTVHLRWLTPDAVQSPTVPDAALFRFITDTRSEKVQDMRENPRAEFMLWFPSSSTQFRVAGKLTILTQADRDTFHALTERERTWFFWPPPGEHRHKALDSENFQRKLPDDPNLVPQCFAVAQLAPDFVEVFDGSIDPLEGPYMRARYDLALDNHTWIGYLINP